MEDNSLVKGQYYGCWCPNITRSHGINRHGIDLVHSEYSFTHMGRVNVLNWEYVSTSLLIGMFWCLYMFVSLGGQTFVNIDFGHKLFLLWLIIDSFVWSYSGLLIFVGFSSQLAICKSMELDGEEMPLLYKRTWGDDQNRVTVLLIVKVS